MTTEFSARPPALNGLTFVRHIGTGGYAEVYLYERHHPKMPVAVKVIKEGALDESHRRIFESEANTMAELAEHPYIVTVFGAETAPDGRPCLLMQYYPTDDLGKQVTAKPLSVTQALSYGVRLAGAVATAHRAQIIHRDIKPSNILLDRLARPALSDFGIAGRPTDVTDDVGVSIPWAPREVLTGESNGSEVSDVYSLAATLWHLLVGHSPFFIKGGDNSRRAHLNRILTAARPPTGRPDVPQSLDRLLQQAMALDPRHRVTSAKAFGIELQRVEQELRLDRTELLILDTDFGNRHASPLDAGPVPAIGPPPGAPAAPSTPADPDEAATLLRTPQVVQQPSRPAQSSARAAAPLPISEPPPGRGAPDHADLVPNRNVAPSAADQVTYRRPMTATTPTSTEPLAAAVDGENRSRKGLWIGITSIVVAALSLVVVLTRSGDDPGSNPVATAPTQVPAPEDVTDVIDPVQGPAAPWPVTAKASGSFVVFRWHRVPGVRVYRIVPDGGAPQAVADTQVRIPRAGEGKTCITISSQGPVGSTSDERHVCLDRHPNDS